MNSVPEGATHYRPTNNLYYKLINGVPHHCQSGSWIWYESVGYIYLSGPGFIKVKETTAKAEEKEMTQTKQSFTKSDLRTGMRVTLRGGGVTGNFHGSTSYIVHLNAKHEYGNEADILVTEGGHSRLVNWEENLNFNEPSRRSWDIIKVEIPTYFSLNPPYQIIWERGVEESETDKQHRELMEQIEELRKKAEALKPGGSK